MDKIEAATEKFKALVKAQLERAERIKADKDFLNFFLIVFATSFSNFLSLFS